MFQNEYVCLTYLDVSGLQVSIFVEHLAITSFLVVANDKTAKEFKYSEMTDLYVRCFTYFAGKH